MIIIVIISILSDFKVLWLGREITVTTWKPSHAVLEILPSEYEKQKQVFVNDIINNGP